MNFKIVKMFGWRLIIGLSLAVGFLLFFAWLSEEVFEGESKIFDETVRNFLHGFAAPRLTELMIFLSFVGSPLFLGILGTIVVAVLFYLKKKRAAVLFLITMAGEIVLDLVLKPFFARVRPDVFFDYPLPLSYSFPSGHALGSLCFYGILAWLAVSGISNKKAKLVLGIAAFALILLIGISRIYLGVHYPSDVLAGFAAGLFWLGVVVITDIQTRPQPE